ncbi:MAG TPA: DUF1802 family protein [Tepidisphaeraceae bacterium]|jgi:hypothetical protein|nr:DUF1802 family protein [Tepidisphaeraceae bacterium]
MSWPESIGVGLKEWAVVCEALARGRQMVLLRKGGISEVEGEFRVAHREFLLFPTYLHQNKLMVKEPERAGVEAWPEEPKVVKLGVVGVVTDIVQLKDRRQIDAIDGEHIWTDPLIEMRFGYKPENPLYLMLVRAYRLREEAVVENTPAYAGCKSWVPLGKEIEVGGAQPAMDEGAYEERRQKIIRSLAGG